MKAETERVWLCWCQLSWNVIRHSSWSRPLSITTIILCISVKLHTRNIDRCVGVQTVTCSYSWIHAGNEKKKVAVISQHFSVRLRHGLLVWQTRLKICWDNLFRCWGMGVVLEHFANGKFQTEINTLVSPSQTKNNLLQYQGGGLLLWLQLNTTEHAYARLTFITWGSSGCNGGGVSSLHMKLGM